MKSTSYLEARIGIEPTNKGFADPDSATTSPSASTHRESQDDSGPVPVRSSVAEHARKLAKLGWASADIGSVLGKSQREIEELIRGHGTKAARKRGPAPETERDEQVSYPYYLRPMRVLHSPSAEDLPTHGPVKQLMRSGKRTNETVWKPKK